MTTVAAYAAPASKAPLERTTIERRAVREHDVLIDIKFAGICHSDIHQAREGWGEAIFPMVPGHEIAGVVSEVGPGVTKYKVGDRVGVGCLVDSCRECDYCRAGLEPYCRVDHVRTYNPIDRDGIKTNVTGILLLTPMSTSRGEQRGTLAPLRSVSDRPLRDRVSGLVFLRHAAFGQRDPAAGRARGTRGTG